MNGLRPNGRTGLGGDRTRKPGCNDAIDGGGVRAVSAAAVETARERERDRSSEILVSKQKFA